MRNARNTAAQQRARSARPAPGGPRRGGGSSGGGMDFLMRPFTLIVAGLVVVFIVVGQRRLDGALVFVGILTFIGQRRRIAVAA